MYNISCFKLSLLRHIRQTKIVWYALNMRYLITLGWMSLALAGCGQAPEAYSQDIAYIVNEFQLDAAAHGKPLVVVSQIGFGDTRAITGLMNAIGACQSGLNQGKITINEAYWVSINDMDKKMLLYHELGHCVLGRAHNAAAQTIAVNAPGFPSTMSVPLSIMNPAALKGVVDGSLYYNQLLDELFR